jgi:hypothetical protein
MISIACAKPESFAVCGSAARLRHRPFFVTVIGAEVELPYTVTGGPDTGQQGAIAFPEYTAVNVLAPGASCDALSGKLAGDSVALVGSSVCCASKV